MNEWHLITSEYPPLPGGVSDYTRAVGEGLALAGDHVHVWGPSLGERPEEQSEPCAGHGVIVHREMGGFTPSDLWRAGRLLNQFHTPRRLLVQYVPHGFGFRSLNVAFCLWLWARARVHSDEVEIMVHEPFLEFRRGPWRCWAAAAVHRLMTLILLRAASRVWTAIPAWEEMWRPFALGRRVSFKWLPVPSAVAVLDDPAGVSAVRALHTSSADGVLVGHLGTYSPHIADYLKRLLPALLSRRQSARVMLLGNGGENLRDEIVRLHPRLAARVHATGHLPTPSLSVHLSACDLMLQPFPDGVSSRRTSIMAALAHGRAVVTMSGRLTEPIWAESGAVALVPAGDVHAMEQAVERLLEEPARRERLAAAGGVLYRKRFDVGHTVAALRHSDTTAQDLATEVLIES